MDIMFHHRDGLSYRHIARRMGIDRRTVKRCVEQPEVLQGKRAPRSRGSKLDSYRDAIEAYLAEDPDYRASWIYDRVKSHGYVGGYELVKIAVRDIKGHNQRLAYTRFETDPGQQAQVDFGEFQVTLHDGSIKKLYLFVLVLGYSRMLYCEILDECNLAGFLGAHVRAFDAIGGVPREILYDRMRNVFIGRVAGKTEFTQALVNLAIHYGFTPRVAPAYAPWVKGKVERPIDFVRESFWRGYGFRDLAGANRDLKAWGDDKAQRVHGTTNERVDERFAREKPHLLALPPYPCDISERLFRDVRKDCTIAVGGNRYVVEHTLVGKKVVVRLLGKVLRIFDGDRLIVTYDVPEGKGRLVQDPRFYAALVADKALSARKFGNRGGRKPKGRATISPSAPRYDVVVEQRPIRVYGELGGEVGYA